MDIKNYYLRLILIIGFLLISRMSYYDDPTTMYYARIASEKSSIVDLKYTYTKVINTIISTNPEDVSEDLIQKQLEIIQQIKDKKQNILILEDQLSNLVTNVIVPPLIPQVIPPLVDLSNNVIVPPLIPQVIPPLVDNFGQSDTNTSTTTTGI